MDQMNGYTSELSRVTGRRVAAAAGAAAAAAALVLTLAGCGSAAAGGVGGRPVNEIDLRATEFAYTPGQVRISGPGQLKVTLQNQGMVEHDFAIEGAQGKLLVKPNSTGTATFAIPKAGTYTFACTVEGHKAAGMKGTLTVGG
jgi:plastocyanin